LRFFCHQSFKEVYRVTITRDPAKGLGVVFDSEGEKPNQVIWIDCLVAGTPAVKEKKIRLGDKLVAVNGQNVQHASLKETLVLLGTNTVTMTLQRTDKKIVRHEKVQTQEGTLSTLPALAAYTAAFASLPRTISCLP
jgi:C-terminal processing protease CtpA/Prc